VTDHPSNNAVPLAREFGVEIANSSSEPDKWSSNFTFLNTRALTLLRGLGGRLFAQRVDIFEASWIGGAA
jgi:hypothetical protein